MKNLMKGETMNFSKKTFAVTALAAAVALAGCSSDNPDAGSAVSKTPVSGTAVDGYIAGATVYIDSNNNGRKNAGEPSAITDQNGYFSTGKEIDGEDGVDYCASGASALQKIHCLKTTEIGSGFVIRTFGGFDVYTGEPFLGSLARRVTPDEDGVVANQMISPLTSMLVDISDEEDQENLLDFFGLADVDLDEDFLDSDGYSAERVNGAIKLHKIVTLFSEALLEQYEEFGEERSFPETPNAIIYKALATQLAESDVLNQSTLTNAFNAAQDAIRDLYEDNEDVSLPGGTVASGSAVTNALDMIELVDDVLPAIADFDDAKARVIGIETVLKKMVDGDNVADVIAEAEDVNSDLYTEIQLALEAEGGDVDFTALTEVNYNAPDYTDIDIVGGGSFANLANQQLYINLNDGDKTGSGYIFFNSEEDASAGELKVCLEYDDGDDLSTEFEETEGVLLPGTWMAIDDSKLILSLAGSLSLNLADKGMNEDDEHRYTLSYGGETRSWLSDEGLLDEVQSENTVALPVDDASCESLLNSSNDNNQLIKLR